MSRDLFRPIRAAVCGALAAAFLLSTMALAQAQTDTTDTDQSQDQQQNPNPAPATHGQQPVTILRPGYPTPEGAPQPGFTLSGSASVSETYTTNEDGVANSEGDQGDFDSRARLQLDALERTADFTGALDYTGQVDVFAHEPSLPVFDNFANGLMDYRPFPEYLHIDARVFAAPIVDNQLGNISPPGTPLPQGANGNISNTYGFAVAPAIEFRLGDFARSDLIPSYGSVFFQTPPGAPAPQISLFDNTPPPRVTEESLVEKITSGDDFYRFHWQLVGSDLVENSEALGLKQREGTADIEYAITRRFAILAEGGYQEIDSDTILSQNLTGPVAYGGVRVQLNSISVFELRAGEEFNSPSYIGGGAIEITPRMYFVFHLTDSIQTPAGRLLDNLSSMDVALQSTGGFQLYNSSSLPAGVAPGALSGFSTLPLDNLAFDTVIERYRMADATLNRRFYNTQVSLVGFGTIADILSPVAPGTDRRQTSEGIALQASRTLGSDITVTANANYTRQDVSGGNDDYLSAYTTVSYALTPKLSTFATATYYERIARGGLSTFFPQVGSANDFAFTVGITRSF